MPNLKDSYTPLEIKTAITNGVDEMFEAGILKDSEFNNREDVVVAIMSNLGCA